MNISKHVQVLWQSKTILFHLALLPKGLRVSDGGLEDAVPRGPSVTTRPIVVPEIQHYNLIIFFLILKLLTQENVCRQPVSSVRHGPGDEGVALLVVGVAGLQLPLGGSGAVAHAPPHPLLRVVVRQLSYHATVLKSNPLQEKHLSITLTFIQMFYLVWQVPPVRARICWDKIDSFLLQRVQRLRDVISQLCGVLAEVSLEVGSWLGLVVD